MALEHLKVYDLTPLTRGAAEQRRAVISGIEFKMRHLIVVGVGAIGGLFLMFLTWPLFESGSVLWVPLCGGVAMWLVEGTSRRGMQLKNWKNLRDKSVNNSGRFFVSGERFDPLANRVGVISNRCLPVGASTDGVVDEDRLAADLGPSRGDPRDSRAVRDAMRAWSAREEETR